MKYRKLRIAWSVAWGMGILCLLLVALWVRSSQHLDEVAVPTAATKFIGASSGRGQLQFYTGTWLPPFEFRNLVSFDTNAGYAGTFTSESAWGFYCRGIHDWYACVPHWFVALVTLIIAATPWIKLSWQY